MPKGELYIKTRKISDILTTPYVPSEMFTSECAYGRGIVNDTNNTYYGYADAWVRYGLSLGDGAIDKLMTATPHKAAKGISSAVSHGVSYNGRTIGIVDERAVSFDAHIVAQSRKDYLKKWSLFKSEVLCKEVGIIVLRTSYDPNVRYRLINPTHEQFRQWISGGAAMFTLSFIEPHPELQESYVPTDGMDGIDGIVLFAVDNESELSVEGGYTDDALAIVMNPDDGHNENLWLYEEDGAPQGGPIWTNGGPTAHVGSLWYCLGDRHLYEFEGQIWSIKQ